MMRKSGVVNFGSLSTSKIVNDYDSNSDDGDNYDVPEQNLFNPIRTKSQEFTVEVSQMVEMHQIPTHVNQLPFCSIKISDKEYFLENYNCPTTPITLNKIDPIECAVINVAHLDQFPKPTSSFSATLPAVFAWTNANTSFSSEYPTTIQSYYKNAYQRIRQRIRFFFSIAPNEDRLNKLSGVRREAPTGRIVFHYVGHGFPPIEKNAIWCSDRRTTDFKRYRLSTLFANMKPPTWFIFDCSNAAVVIPQFEETSRMMQANDPDGNWDNWICICATDVGESLPDDPRLPKDFLSSCILTALKMGIMCHVLQNYRTNLVGPNFPKEIPFQNLYSEKSKEAASLTLALSALTDAIAADGLPKDLYHKIFRCDRSSAVIFRNVLFAQFLLRPYRVHPVTRPALPDLSMHPLWRQWSVLLDTAICSVSVQRPNFSSDLFKSAAQTFQMLLRNRQFSLMKPYHLTLLFHMLILEPANNDLPIQLLAEYAAAPEMDPQMLCSAAVFHALFQLFLQKDPRSPVYHPMCFLVLVLLYHKPELASEIRKELDFSKFPALVFEKRLNESTRNIVAAIIANLAVDNETLQQVCTSYEFLSNVCKELGTANPLRATWLILVIRRAFHLYSPDPAVYVGNGLHVQLFMHLFNDSPMARAAAVSAVTCFMRPFECNVNGQLLYLALPVVCDASFLVRFHFVLLLKKFVTSFENYSDSVVQDEEFAFDRSSFDAIAKSCLGPKAALELFARGNVEFLELIDDSVHSKDFISHAYAIAMALLGMFVDDPHPSVAALAVRVTKYIARSRLAYDQANNNEDLSAPSSLGAEACMDHFSYSGEDDSFEEENFSFANIDQNESLHEICLHNLVASRIWQPPTATPPSTNPRKSLPPAVQDSIPICEFSLMKTLKLGAATRFAFHRDTLGIAGYNDEEVFFVDQKDTRTAIPVARGQVCSLTVVSWSESPGVLFATTDGCVHLWRPPSTTLAMTFCADPAAQIASQPILVAPAEDPFVVYTVNAATGRLCKWNLGTERFLGEWDSGSRTEVTCIVADPKAPSSVVIGSRNGVIREIFLGDPKAAEFKMVVAPYPKASVVYLGVSFARQTRMLAVMNTGEVSEWEDIDRPIDFNLEHPLGANSIAVHPLYPMIAIAPKDASPFVASLEGQTLYTFRNLPPGCSVACHPLLAVILFALPDGSVYLYNLNPR